MGKEKPHFTKTFAKWLYGAVDCNIGQIKSACWDRMRIS